MINHIVLFRTKPDNDLRNILETGFFKLKRKIHEIQFISDGNNISKEGFDKSYNKGCIILFEDKINLQTYLVSEAHKEFVDKYVKDTVEDVLVFDYEI